ncbi:MAG: lamin tail domain-containing protein, partial [Patescibacteria group bacterium]
MKQKFSILFVALSMFVVSTPSPLRAQIEPRVIISEIAWAGSTMSTADEWLELTNMTSEPIDMTGWQIVGAASSTLTLPTESIIAPYATFLIANYDHTHKNSARAAHSQFISPSVSLPNDKLSITIYKNDSTLVDSAGDGGNPFTGGSLSARGADDGRFRTMERRGSLLDGHSKESWADADVSLGFKDEVSDHGTPGTLNAFLQKEIDVMKIPDTITTSEPESVCTDIVVSETTTDISQEPAIVNDQLLVTNPIVTEQSNATTTESTSPLMTTASSTSTSIAITSTTNTSGTLRINELYTRPLNGESEWVEIENISSVSITTNGWSITDASGGMTLFPNGTIPPGSFLVIENPKGKLNNDGDTLVIKDADGVIVDAVQYNADLGLVPDMGESLIRIDKHTLLITTTPTKNSENISTQKQVKILGTDSTGQTNKPTPSSDAEISIIATNTNATPMVPKQTSQEQTSASTTIKQDPQKQPVITTPISISHTIRLSELYPNTGGNDATDEFIEIKNDGDEIVSLESWSITDASGNRFTFPKTATMNPHTFLAVMRPQSHLTLNNDGDTVTLIAPDASIADSHTYEKTKPNFSLATIDGIWTSSGIPTPNEQNRASQNNEST